MRKIKELRKIEIKKRSAKYEKTKGSAKKDKKEITEMRKVTTEKEKKKGNVKKRK